MQGRLAQFLTGLLPILFGEVLFEGNRLLKVECFEVFVLGVVFKPCQRLCSRIHGWLAIALGLFQIGEILALDPFIFCMVFCHDLLSLFQVTVHGRLVTIN